MAFYQKLIIPFPTYPKVLFYTCLSAYWAHLPKTLPLGTEASMNLGTLTEHKLNQTQTHPWQRLCPPYTNT